jgi:hypothetical protein
MATLQPAFCTEKMAQLAKLADQDAKLAVIYEWVKTGHISRAIFKELIRSVIIVDFAIARELGEQP